jgi:hypothetical protein
MTSMLREPVATSDRAIHFNGGKDDQTLIAPPLRHPRQCRRMKAVGRLETTIPAQSTAVAPHHGRVRPHVQPRLRSSSVRVSVCGTVTIEQRRLPLGTLG